jgi:hypothetical protein
MNRERWLGFLRALLLSNWGTKISAVLLAIVVFLVTRDEIHRTFQLPLVVVMDPQRILLTELPETVTVEIRGPWQRLNRIGRAEMGSATLDLEQAQDGPLHIDPATVVMPAGVILERLEYDTVDLRFEPVVERSLPIEARLVGEVSEDHELVGVEVSPAAWTVRGGRGSIEGLTELATEPIEIGHATRPLELRAALQRPPGRVEFTGTSEGPTPEVGVTVRVRARAGERALTVPVLDALRIAAPWLDVEVSLPAEEQVVLRGPRPSLRALEGVEQPLQPAVQAERRREGTTFEVRFAWKEHVDPAAREGLTIEPTVVRFSVETRREL